ncbi:MAG TPA: PCYCGC motif-containing (lipo)protein [Candidatus Methanoperedens sp.]|nr:PCYCGC motif-containing (lipo)protein [Candidatus Methanoperedens sp.]
MKPEKKQDTEKKSKKMPKKKGNNSIILIAVAAVILIGAYALFSGGSQTTEPKQTMTLKEVRALIDKEYGNKAPGTNTPPVKDNYLPILIPRKADKLPDFAVTNAMTLKAYKYATEHPEVLEQIPCYCGCGEHGSVTSGGKPHMSVRDCFISNDGVYDDHASFCDVCVGIASKAQSYFPAGIPVTGLSAATPAPSIDLSTLSLSENFKSIADGLKLTQSGINRAYFVNTKLITGTELENQLLNKQVQPDSFYGKKIIGMFSADYSTNSWIELHDLGYDSKNDGALKGRTEPGMKNIVITRPLVYGHSQNVDNVLKLISDPNSMNTSYPAFKPLLDAVDYQNAAYTIVIETKNKFSDINYMGLTPAGGKIELVRAFNVTDSKSIPSGFSKYNPETKGNILVIKTTGDYAAVMAENDNIDAVAIT